MAGVKRTSRRKPAPVPQLPEVESVVSIDGSLPRPVGSNHVGMRQFNERIVLQAIRLHGALPKADVARLTRLSTQTASVIINGLLKDGLVTKQPRVRGRIGQPSVPIALNPDGAFAVGIKVGRRSLDVLAMDFVGNVRYRDVLEYAYPDPGAIFPTIRKELARIDSQLGRNARRVVGVGVAAPLWLGGWRDFLGAPTRVMEEWSGIDIGSHIQSMTELPVQFAKDTTAACAAELVVGQGRSLRNFLYLFIGTFIGGGLVLDGRLHPGPRGNAGAVGSLPLRNGSGHTVQLLHKASGLVLEQLLKQHRIPLAAAHDERSMSEKVWPHTQRWLQDACPALAMTVGSAAAMLDLDAVILDGSMDRRLLAELIERTNQVLDTYDWEGVARPPLTPGSIGADARAMGGAILPLYAHFAPTHELFLKTATAGAN
jgi:predicted NBD/HSP70 family sugar kinase